MIKKSTIFLIILMSILLVMLSYFKVMQNEETISRLNKQEDILALSYESITNSIEDKSNGIIELEKEKRDLTLLLSSKKAKLKEETAKYNLENNIGTKIAYLTFDDGPSKYTKEILDILDEYNVKATFFVNGKEDSNSIAMYKRIVADGHAIGNHTYTHNFNTVYKSLLAFDNDFNRLEDLILKETNVKMKIMRFPGGSNTPFADDFIKEITKRYLNNGYQYFDWNVSAADSDKNATDISVYNSVISECKSKESAIILMHDPKLTTVDTLEKIIIELSNEGFKFRVLTTSTTPIHFKI